MTNQEASKTFHLITHTSKTHISNHTSNSLADSQNVFGDEFARHLAKHFQHQGLSVHTIHASAHGEVDTGTHKPDCIANTSRINNIVRINKFFELANQKLQLGGYLIGYIESNSTRKKRILSRYPPYISRPIYLSDIILNRLAPKWKITQKAHYKITKGKSRPITKTETLGRLVCCGFEIADHYDTGGNTYFIAQKTGDPSYNRTPAFGIIVKLNRYGKNNKTIKVYKLRTMHPYSEYLQDYIHKTNSLQESGKFKDDFRITRWGKICRKLWIDEIPMLINVIRGDIKLVGVRPLSRQYYNLYPPALRQKRVHHKPGLIPPFYADLPKNFKQITHSEEKYLKAYAQKPVRTDLKYFYRAFKNIVFRGARSG
ncbi:MAG: sugar transferase [Balneolales bacterium]